MGRNPAPITPMAIVPSGSTGINTYGVVNTASSSVSGSYVGGNIRVGPNYQTVKPWHRWWAWRPVTTVGGERVWLKWCHRRIIQWNNLEVWPSTTRTEYGNLFDVIKTTTE